MKLSWSFLIFIILFNTAFAQKRVDTLRSKELQEVRAGINNIFNKQYFTKRPTFYPGPGIWPSDGRNVYTTVSIKI